MTDLEYFLTKHFLQIFYLIFRLFPVNENKALFATPRNDVLQGNLHAIYRELQKERPEVKAVFLLDTYGYSMIQKVLYLLKLVRGLYHVQTSGWVILDNAYLPVHLFPHKKKTRVIQTWHACGAFKKFGRSTMGLAHGLKSPETLFLHRNYDFAICTSQSVVPCYAEAFGMEEKQVIPLGVPRTDFFFDHKAMERQKKRVFEDLPQIRGKKILLYAPTFRGRGKEKESRFPLDPRKILQGLGEEYVLLVKPHPHAPMKGVDETLEGLVRVPDEYPLNALFTVADMLITDYSSVIFEFALLGKPMVFFAYDLEEYQANSAFYWSYEEFVPGPVAKDEEELLGMLQGGMEEKSTEDFAREWFDHLDGDSTKRFVQYFF